MPCELVAAVNLTVGDLVDLEGDPFADPNKDNVALQCEYAEVESIDQESDTCVVVSFSYLPNPVGFPLLHQVKREFIGKEHHP